MIIPPQELTRDTLDAILQEFVSRDGTDYGEVELSLHEKVERLRPQVLSGEVLIVFDEQREQVTLLNRRDAPAF